MKMTWIARPTHHPPVFGKVSVKSTAMPKAWVSRLPNATAFRAGEPWSALARKLAMPVAEDQLARRRPRKEAARHVRASQLERLYGGVGRQQKERPEQNCDDAGCDQNDAKRHDLARDP